MDYRQILPLNGRGFENTCKEFTLFSYLKI